MPDKFIFETPCYSVENFYVSIAVFQEIIKTLFQVSEASDFYRLLVDIYQKQQTEFHDAVLLFNAWYACIVGENEKTGKRSVKLDSKFPKGFLDISLEGVVKNYDIDRIKAEFPEAHAIPDDLLEQKIKEFSTTAMHLKFRGKYELQFLLTILSLLSNDSNKEQIVIKEKFKSDFGQLSNDQALSVFSPFAETPGQLIEYIKQSIL